MHMKFVEDTETSIMTLRNILGKLPRQFGFKLRFLMNIKSEK